MPKHEIKPTPRLLSLKLQYANEILNKEHRINYLSIKSRAEKSQNLLFKAMNHDGLYFNGGSKTSSSSIFNASTGLGSNTIVDMTHFEMSNNKDTLNKTRLIPSKNLCDDDGGKVLLSKGALPSNIPADWSKLPTLLDWKIAEQKHDELKKELDSLDDEIKSRNRLLKSSIDNTMRNNTIHMDPSIDPKQAMTETLRGSASIVGSSFTWGANKDASMTKGDFSWPDKIDQSAYTITKTQYGSFTKFCDRPEGNIFINKQAKTRKKV